MTTNRIERKPAHGLPNNAMKLTATPRSAFAERYQRSGAAPHPRAPRNTARRTGALPAAGRQLIARAVGRTEQTGPEPEQHLEEITRVAPSIPPVSPVRH